MKPFVSEKGQATLEAAVLLPTTALLVALLVQPACLYYTRALMQAAAGEAARAAITAYGGDLEACTSFAKRRLRAVPEASCFHVGGEGDWDISISCKDGQADVSIAGHARPLPLLGILASAFAESDGKGIILRTEVCERLRPTWLGGDYESWQTIWG